MRDATRRRTLHWSPCAIWLAGLSPPANQPGASANENNPRTSNVTLPWTPRLRARSLGFPRNGFWGPRNGFLGSQNRFLGAQIPRTDPHMCGGPRARSSVGWAATWGANTVSSCRPYSRAKGPGTSAEAFPTARSLAGENTRGPRRGAKVSGGTPWTPWVGSPGRDGKHGRGAHAFTSRVPVVHTYGRFQSRCRFAPPLIHATPGSLRESVPLFLKRQCDRTLRLFF